MVGSIDPGCEQIRGTHWPNKGRVVDWNSCRGNHLGQRSQNDRINRPDIWTQAIRLHIKKLLRHGGRPHMDASDPITHQKALAPRGPSTYGSRLALRLAGTTS